MSSQSDSSCALTSVSRFKSLSKLSLELLGQYEENAYMMRMMRVAGHKDTNIMELDGYGHGIIEPAVPLLLDEVRRLSAKKDKT